MSVLDQGVANYTESITPSDTVDQPAYTYKGRLTDGIWVGGAGTLTVVLQDNTVVSASFTGATAGTTIRVAARRVNATGTSATALRALYVI